MIKLIYGNIKISRHIKYIIRIAPPMSRFNLDIGGDLEYSDADTIKNALENRK